MTGVQTCALPISVSCRLRVHCSARHPHLDCHRRLLAGVSVLPFALCHSRGSTQQPGGPLKIRVTVAIRTLQAPHLLRDRAPLQPPLPPPRPLGLPPASVTSSCAAAPVVGRPSGRPSLGWPHGCPRRLGVRGNGTFSRACPAARVLCPLLPFISPTSLSTLLQIGRAHV